MLVHNKEDHCENEIHNNYLIKKPKNRNKSGKQGSSLQQVNGHKNQHQIIILLNQIQQNMGHVLKLEPAVASK